MTTVHDPADIAALLELSDERDQWWRLRLAAFREGYQVGREDEAAERDAAWNAIASAAIRGPSHADLEERRWGPGGRARFADPRPDDYPGRGASAA